VEGLRIEVKRNVRGLFGSEFGTERVNEWDMIGVKGRKIKYIVFDQTSYFTVFKITPLK
jgi:hypothetical protein